MWGSTGRESSTQYLEPLVVLQSSLGYCLGKVAPVDLALRHLAEAAWRPPRRAKDKGVRARCLPVAAQPSWV